jgi:Zn-dependent protease
VFGVDPYDLLIRAPVVLFALTIHEFMHGWVAWKCGDDTALRAGRLTLNPLPHLDLMGTIMLLLPGSPIGWAKPVPVNPYHYHRPRRDDILVSGAGIAANFTLAVLLALGLRAAIHLHAIPTGKAADVVLEMVWIGILINFGLSVFNLLPFFPLDGSHILRNLLPAGMRGFSQTMTRVGPFLLLGVILLNMALEQRYHMSPLGYPILWLTQFFTGLDLGVGA